MIHGKKKLCIGVDVSKATIDIYYQSKSHKILNNKKCIRDFIKKEISSTENTLCAMESTGGYERVAAKTFMDHQIPVHIAHPYKIHNFAKASGQFAKTDKLDAKLIHHYAQFIADKEEGTLIIDQKHQDIIALRRLAASFETTLHGMLCSVKQTPDVCTKHLNKAIASCKSLLLRIQQEIDEKIDSHDGLKVKRDIMTSMKGVGNKTASIILAELPELGTLCRGKITNLAGLAPKTHQSGKKNIGGHITGGRFYARKALYMVALVAIKYDPFVKRKYESFLKRGKPKKVAIVALMRDALITLNSMLKNGENYRAIA